MTSAIRDHFSNTRHHDPQYMSYKNRAKEYIYNEFVRFGLETEYHTFHEPRVSSTVQFHTVVGVLKGTKFGTKDDSILGVGAHYDTVNTTKGVDDNGAGVAAMLEVIRQITNMNKKGTKRGNTIIFASFDLEENQLSGSRHFVESWLPLYLGIHYGSAAPTTGQGVIVFDTPMEYKTTNNSQLVPDAPREAFKQAFPVAYKSVESDNFRGDFLNLIYRQPTADSKLANTFKTSWQTAGRSQYELELFPLQFSSVSNLTQMELNFYSNFLSSDHYNFWTKMFPAIQLTDSANFRGNMIQCYHKPCDNLETLLTYDNINFLGKTADVTVMTIHKLSEPTSEYDTATEGLSAGGIAGIVIGILLPLILISVLVLCMRRNRNKFT